MTRKFIVSVSTCLALAACDQKPASEKPEDSKPNAPQNQAAASAKEKSPAVKEEENSLAE